MGVCVVPRLKKKNLRGRSLKALSYRMDSWPVIHYHGVKEINHVQ